MGGTGFEPVRDPRSGFKFDPGVPMTLAMKPFFERQIRKPLPGALADDARLYIAMRELEG
jgi:hypothetical protein